MHFFFWLSSISHLLVCMKCDIQSSVFMFVWSKKMFCGVWHFLVSAGRSFWKKTGKFSYNSKHPLLFFLLRTCSAALVAISNTSLTPSLVLAEHSRYPKALIRLAMSLPSSGLTGSCETDELELNHHIQYDLETKYCLNCVNCAQLKPDLWHAMSIPLAKWIDLTEAICPDNRTLLLTHHLRGEAW